MSDVALTDWLNATAAGRAARGLHRELRMRAHDDHMLDLAGNDYLALAHDPRVVAAAVEAAKTWGCGATGSRLVTGSTRLHAELEAALAEFCDARSALVFASGYAANLAVLTALTDADTLIVSDERNHASLIDGCRLSRARTVVVAHRDVDAFEKELIARSETRALVVTDAIFSVDGERAPLALLLAACRRQGAVLVVDEAHALGVVGARGSGLAAEDGVAGEPDVIRTITLSKSLGAQGGAVLASPEIVAHLIDTARTFIFDTGLAPPSAGAALRALQLLAEHPPWPAFVRQRAAELANGLGVPVSDAAIVSLPVPDPSLAVAAAKRCADQGVLVGCFRPPSVPDTNSRLRLTARADLTDADVARALEVVQSALAVVA